VWTPNTLVVGVCTFLIVIQELQQIMLENTDKVPQFTEIFLQVGMGHLRIADAADLD
jgi:hypothetical protein